MTFKFSDTSAKRLATTATPIQRIFNTVMDRTECDFGIAQGIRTLEQQKEYLNAGNSKTKNSRHLHTYAVDIYAYDGKALWSKESIEPIAKIALEVADELGYELEWGGNWKFLDAPHFQLSHKQFPDKPEVLKEINDFDWG